MCGTWFPSHPFLSEEDAKDMKCYLHGIKEMIEKLLELAWSICENC